MSARCTAAVFERYPAGGGEMLLALALADNAHQDGTHIFIGVDKMAEKSRQTVRNVQLHLRTMLDAGWLLVTRRGGGRGRATEYRISPAWLNGEKISPFPPAPDVPEKAAKGEIPSGFSAPERVKSSAQKGEKQRTPYITDRTLLPPTPLKGGDDATPNSGEKKTRSQRAQAPGFGAIAAAYPQRARIDAARRDYDALAPDEALQATILQAIEAWKRSPAWQRDSGGWIPGLGKFIRDKRWLDAPGMAPPPRAAAPQPAAAPPPVSTPESRAAAQAAMERGRAIVRESGLVRQRRAAREEAVCS